MQISELQRNSWEYSERQGFHEDEANRNIPTKLMLIVVEVAEALEEFRDGKIERYYNPEKPTKPEGVAPELADVVIRVGDLAHMLGIDLNREIEIKMMYNNTRPRKHGGKSI